MSTANAVRLKSAESMKVARWLLENRYYSSESRSRSNLVYVNGSLWAHEEGRWTWKDLDWLEKDLYKALEDVHVMVGQDKDTGAPIMKRYASMGKGSYGARVRDVLGCITAIITEKERTMPFWRSPEPGDPDPRFCISFPNTILYVGEDGLKGVNQTDRFVTRCTLPVPYDPEANSELWEKCVDQWSAGDEAFKETLQRWWGYVLLPFRGYAACMYMFGKIRAGKGLQMRLCEHLLGGYPVFTGLRLEDLAHQFGLDGAQDASVIGVSEVSRMDRMDGERASAELKRILGEDTGPINQKYGKILKGVRITAAPWLCGNEIMEIGNKNEGLSGKLVPLYFKKSFASAPNPFLEEQLKQPEHLKGMVKWAVEGAIKLMAAPSNDRWAMGNGSKEVLRLFRLYNNPLEQFLDTCFVANEKGFVKGATVRKMWASFKKENNLKVHVPSNQLLVRMEQETSWALERYTRDEGPRGQAGLKGILIKKRDMVQKDL